MVQTDNDSKTPIPNGSGMANSNAGHNTTDSTKNNEGST